MIPPMTVQLYKALRDICRGISRSDEPDQYALFTRIAIEEAIRLPGESPACIIVLNSQRGEIIDIVCICRMLRDT